MEWKSSRLLCVTLLGLVLHPTPFWRSALPTLVSVDMVFVRAEVFASCDIGTSDIGMLTCYISCTSHIAGVTQTLGL